MSDWEISGKVKFINEQKGYGFITPSGELPASFVQYQQSLPLEKRDVYFTTQQSVAAGLTLQANSPVRIRVRKGETSTRFVGFLDGPKRSVAAGARRVPRSGGGAATEDFLNPYNFVPWLDGGDTPADAGSMLSRSRPATHDRYLPERNTGSITCTLTTKTPLFIPDPRKRKKDFEEKPGHDYLGYFTLEEVEARNPGEATADGTKPAIPASSLRGMVRSLYETVTGSCYAVFHDRTLEYRVDRDPGYFDSSKGMKLPSGRGHADYVPARILKVREDGPAPWMIQILDATVDAPLEGFDDSGDGALLKCALFKTYDPRVRTGTSHGSATRLWADVRSLDEGAPVVARLSWTIVSKGRYRYFEVEELHAAEDYAEIHRDSGPVVFGYLHRTGPNIEKKNHERLFFRWEDYNEPKSSLSEVDLQQRYDAFLADAQPSIPLTSQVRQYNESIDDYWERHGKRAKSQPEPPRKPCGKASELPFFSDFVYQGGVKLRHGTPVYALTECNNGVAVHSLHPVAMPRLPHEDTTGSLLPKEYHPCTDFDNLCPACRVFGWVRQTRSENRDALVAVAGHVAFSHGTLKSKSSTWTAENVTLDILSSPKPTATVFYLRPTTSYTSERGARWPPSSQQRPFPMYRRGEATLRGRKFYRHHTWKEGRLLSGTEVPRPNGAKDNQNKTVHVLREPLELSFEVRFDNLTDAELGALLWSLAPTPPPGFAGEISLWHKLGMGKPLGMGSCSVKIDRLQLAANPERYKSFADDGTKPPETNRNDEVGRCTSAFWDDVKCVLGDDLTANDALAQLVEILRSDPPDEAVHYPRLARDKDPKGENFKWFVTKKKEGDERLLPEPTEERNGKRLLYGPSPKPKRQGGPRRRRW